MRTVIALTLWSLALASNAADTQRPQLNSGQPASDNGQEVVGNDQAEEGGKDVQAAPAQPPVSPASSPSTAARRPTDRLELDTTVVTGNRELPKVLYIVPWKKADIGDLPAQPFNTLLDEALMPLDRDVFRREVTYYGAASAAADAPGTAPVSPAGGPEK